MSEAPPAFKTSCDGGILTLNFCRPEAGNAIPQSAVGGLTALFRSIADDSSVRVLFVRGEGAHFSAGGDVRSFAASLDQSAEERQADFAQRLDAVSHLVVAYMAIEVPIVVACQGAVAGAGLMYPLGADYVLVDGTAQFLFSHQRLGLTPDGGVSLLLPRAVGVRRAAELVLTAAKVTADDAYRIGLASRVVTATDLQLEGRKQAERFARAPVAAVRTAKRLIADSIKASEQEQLRAERDAIVDSVGNPDFAEGVRAFLEKRPAIFPSTL